MSVRFDNSTDFFSRTASLPSQATLTTMAWINQAVLTGAGGFNLGDWFAIAGAVDGEYHSVGIQTSGGNGLVYVETNYNDVDSSDAGSAISLDTWSHVAFVHSGNDIVVYLDGVVDASFTKSGSFTATRFFIGSSHFSNAFNGRIASFLIYEAALSDAEIQQQLRQIAPVRLANLWAWYPMADKAVADCAIDYSGNGRNLTINGALTIEDGPPIPWKQGSRRTFILSGAPSQIARPDGDVSAGGWTSTTLFSKVDEAGPDDSDFITSASGPSNDICELSLSNLTDPSASGGHVLRVRRKKSASSSNQIDMRYRLLQGATQIASWTDDTNISDAAFEIVTRTLTGGEADAVTDYSDLRVEIRANQNTQTPTAPTFTAAGTAANTATASTGISPGLPASFQADDIFIMVAHHSSNTDFNDPAGWTRIAALSGNNTSAQRVVVWWRRAQVGDTAPSITASTSTAVRIARIYGFRGCITTGDPWDVNSRSANAASATIASSNITTTVANCRVAFFGAYEDDPTTASLPTGYTAIGVSGTTTGNDAMLCGWHKALSGTGSENPSTTVSGGTFTNSVNTGIMIALKPEPFPSVAAQVSWLEFQVPGVTAGGGTTLNFTATITPAGALARQVQKPFAGTITPAGALSRAASLIRSYIATITPSGLLSNSVTRLLTFTATITPSGLLASTKLIFKAFTATITPAGALINIKAVIRFFTATITPAGSLSKAASIIRAYTATITPVGALSRAASLIRAYTATITPAGLLSSAATRLRTYTGTITPVGAFVAFKVIVRNFVATITPAGVFSKINIKSFVGLITLAGTLTKTAAFIRSFTGTIAPAGSLFKTIFKSFTGVITAVGSFVGGLFGVADKMQVVVGDRLKTQALVSDRVKTQVAVSDRIKTNVTVSDELGN
jgi:hypothetical protein